MRKRKRVIGLMLSAVLTFALVFTAAACGTDDWTVTVNGGSGGGSYAPGASVTVTADEVDGRQFTAWTDESGERVSTENPYTFTAEKDVTLTAETVSTETFTVSVTGGTIGADKQKSVTVHGGESVTVNASVSQARRFNKFLVNGTTEVAQNPYTFTVTADTEIAAVLDEICLVSVTGGSVNGKRSDKFDAGASVTVVADAAEGMLRFAYWYMLDVNGAEVRLSDDAEYTFTLTESTKLYARQSLFFTVSVTGGYAGDSAENTALDVAENQRCTVTPINPALDFAFTHWEADGETVSTDYAYTFRVTGDTALTARFTQVETTRPLAAPDNSTNELFFPEGTLGSSALAFDRFGQKANNKVSMLQEGVDHIKIHIYDSNDAAAEAVGAFKFVPDRESEAEAPGGWFRTLDGKVELKLKGQPANYYLDTVNFGDFVSFLRRTLGYDYSAASTYRFAFQTVAAEGTVNVGGVEVTYLDSAVSAKTTWGYRNNASAPTGKFTVSVIGDGLIDGTETTVTAGYGVQLTLTAPEPEEGFIFAGWMIATEDGEGGYNVGSTPQSALLSYTLTVTGDVVLTPVYRDENEVVSIELAAPDNSSNQMIRFNGAQILYDRGSGTAFSGGVAYIEFHIYVSNAADAAPVASFKMIRRGDDSAYFESMDGSSTHDMVRGTSGNYSTGDGNTHNWIKDQIISKGTDGAYSNTKAYYYACRAIAAPGSVYTDSAIGAKGQGWVNI